MSIQAEMFSEAVAAFVKFVAIVVVISVAVGVGVGYFLLPLFL